MPRTSQINPYEYVDFWTPLLAEGKPILHLSLGAAISGSYANSLVVDPWGNVIARASNHPQVITAEIDLDYLQQVRRQIFTLENRRPDVYSLLRTKQ